MKVLKWGVIGSGWISHMFANTVKDIEGAEVYGVADIAPELAEKFQNEFSLPVAFKSVDSMMACDEIDCIFVGTPHSSHKEMILKSVDAGKPVLCAKPIALTSAEVEEIISYAKKKNVLVYENMWTEFKPCILDAKEKIKAGVIGDIVKFEGHCSFFCEFDPNNRLFDKKRGGGSMLDVGVYAVALSQFFLGEDPVEIKALANVGPTGCDHTTNVIMRYNSGALSFITSGMLTDEYQEVYIVGTKGSIRIPQYWYTDRYTLEIFGKGKEEIVAEVKDESKPNERHDYLIKAFCDYVRDGKPDSDVVPMEDTLKVAKIMDEALRQVGVIYNK